MPSLICSLEAFVVSLNRCQVMPIHYMQCFSLSRKTGHCVLLEHKAFWMMFPYSHDTAYTHSKCKTHVIMVETLQTNRNSLVPDFMQLPTSFLYDTTWILA